MKKKKSTRKRQLKKQLRQNRQRILIASALLFATIIGVIVWAVGGQQNTQQGRLVTFHDRGSNQVILTRATTVSQALKDANIAVAPQDIVEPALDGTLLSTDSAVIIYRARPVLVVDGALKQKVVTASAAPNEIAIAAGLNALKSDDKTAIKEADIITDGASQILTIERSIPPDPVAANKPTPQTLTASKGAQIFVDSSGVAHRETYYDLPMNIVIGACGPGDYTIRYDGAKVDKDGYVLVAANYGAYPRCSIVETSMGLGKVYDTGGFALRYPHGFDLATDWTNFNGR